MICSLQNISTVFLLVDFDDGYEALLKPLESVLYDDSLRVVTEPTWELVNMGLLEDSDTELLTANPKPLHNWLAEGF